MLVSGWDLEPSLGGSPSKRYVQRVKAVAEAMRQCWNMAAAEEALAPPGDGPLGAPTPHDVFGRWSSWEEGGPPLPAGAGAAAFPSTIRLGVDQHPAEAPSNSPPLPVDTRGIPLSRRPCGRKRKFPYPLHWLAGPQMNKNGRPRLVARSSPAASFLLTCRLFLSTISVRRRISSRWP